MNFYSQVILFAILVVFFIETLSCLFGNWCIGDKRREGRNLQMDATYFIGGALAYMFAGKVLSAPFPNPANNPK
jgi:hypothetical protein